MFRKVITELAYSPALAGNLGYYVKQLRNEVSRRQIGIIFILLAIIVQLFAALSPPESANANNPNIFIDEQIQSIDEYLKHYDQNTRNIKDLLNSLGITRSEVEAAKLARAPLVTQSSWSLENPRDEKSNVYFFTTSNTTPGIAYYQTAPSEAMNTLAYVGTSSKMHGQFAITQDGAALLTEKEPTSVCASWATTSAVPLKVDSWFKVDNPACSSLVDASLSVREISASSANIEKLQASDRIAYTLSITNNSDKVLSVAPSMNLEDALEYSRILDYGGGEYNFDTRNLSWPTVQIEVGSSIKRTLITQILPSIPATARGQYVSESYNCTVTTSFGNTISTPVDCPPTKYIEQLTSSLPNLSVKLNIFAPACLILVSLFLYLRSRQLLTELYIIRHKHLGGL